jgi:hypothetical protein
MLLNDDAIRREEITTQPDMAGATVIRANTINPEFTPVNRQRVQTFQPADMVVHKQGRTGTFNTDPASA